MGGLQLDELVVQILELLKAVVVFEQPLHCAFFIVQELLHRGAALAAVAAPERAIQKAIRRGQGKGVPSKT